MQISGNILQKHHSHGVHHTGITYFFSFFLGWLGVTRASDPPPVPLRYYRLYRWKPILGENYLEVV